MSSLDHNRLIGQVEEWGERAIKVPMAPNKSEAQLRAIHALDGIVCSIWADNISPAEVERKLKGIIQELPGDKCLDTGKRLKPAND